MTHPTAAWPATTVPARLPTPRAGEPLCPLCHSPYAAYGCTATLCRALDVD